jgi:hypothetical protein
MMALAPTLFPADTWTRLTSSNFELYTTAGEKKGREAILYFEQVRGVFNKLLKSGLRPGPPVRIIAFRSEKEYKPYRINEFATAYYHGGGAGREYIVMSNIGEESYPVAIHEFTHLIVQHAGGPPMPIWLNEGLAEVYSTLKPFGKQVRLGDPIPGRLYELRERRAASRSPQKGSSLDQWIEWTGAVRNRFLAEFPGKTRRALSKPTTSSLDYRRPSGSSEQLEGPEVTMPLAEPRVSNARTFCQAKFRPKSNFPACLFML